MEGLDVLLAVISSGELPVDQYQFLLETVIDEGENVLPINFIQVYT